MFAMYRDQARGDVFDMAYTQLGGDCIAQLYAFLGLAPHTIELPNRKLHSSDTLSRSNRMPASGFCAPLRQWATLNG